MCVFFRNIRRGTFTYSRCGGTTLIMQPSETPTTHTSRHHAVLVGDSYQFNVSFNELLVIANLLSFTVHCKQHVGLCHNVGKGKTKRDAFLLLYRTNRLCFYFQEYSVLRVDCQENMTNHFGLLMYKYIQVRVFSRPVPRQTTNSPHSG